MASKDFQMELMGARELDRLLGSLSSKVSKDVQRKAVRAATTPILKAYRQNLKTIGSVSGRLRKAAARKIKAYGRTDTVVGIIGAKARAAPHAFLVEYGSYKADPRRHKSGKSTGRMPAYAPLRNAFHAQLAEAKQIMRRKLAQGVKDEALKLRRRAG